MSSLQSLRELISERLAAAAEEICRLCEGTIVQYEQELCRQRRLLDICWKPQLQLHHIDLPQQWVTEDEDLCKQQRNSRMAQEEFKSPQVEKEQEEPELPQTEEEQEEPEPPQIKDEQEEFYISQDEEQLDVKQETETLMEIPIYVENTYSITDLNSQQSFYATENEEGSQPEESTSTDLETEPQNRDQRKRRDGSHVQSVDGSDMSGSQCDSDVGQIPEMVSLLKKQEQSPKEKSLSLIKSVKRTRIAHNVFFQMRTQADKRTFFCEECGKSFGCWSHFRIHSRIHTGEKPFSCKECAKKFSNKCNLKTHMRTHTGVKPFSCKVCNTSFSQISNLKTHMRTHTGEKPFSCNECNACFSHKTSLKKHARTHTREEPFSCSKCDQSYTTKFSLQRHLKTHTGEDFFFS